MQAWRIGMIKPYLKFSFTLDWMASRKKHAISPRAPRGRRMAATHPKRSRADQRKKAQEPLAARAKGG